jgi:hypothetical protein
MFLPNCVLSEFGNTVGIEVDSVRNPNSTMFHRVNGILIGDWFVIDTARLPFGAMVAADGRGLPVLHRAKNVILCLRSKRLDLSQVRWQRESGGR